MTKNNWGEISWIFDPDGSWRDIYVQDISIEDWASLIDLLNLKYDLHFSSPKLAPADKIDKAYIIDYLNDQSGELESPFVTVKLGEISANCHFFLPNQIEFDIDPSEVNSINDFDQIAKFMISVSEILENQVTLTWENDIKFPLIKVDVDRNINTILSKRDVRRIRKTNNFFRNSFQILKSRFMWKLFPQKVKKELLDSANEPYVSTSKSENIW
jgi:hypothetical protein